MNNILILSLKQSAILFQEVQEITEKSQQIYSVIAQIRDTFHSLFNQPTHIVPLRQNKRSKHSVFMKHHKMNIGMKIKFELYGEQCINWLKSTIRLIKVSREVRTSLQNIA